MTDAELIARLRDDSGDWLTDAAADRIEALTAKLAKAVEALRMIASIELTFLEECRDIARAALAEIKGESRE